MIKKTLRNPEFWLAAAMVVIAILFLFQYHPDIVVTVHPVYHLFSWLGSSYIAVAVPFFLFLKRRLSSNYQAVARFHIFGNLIAFALICLHVTYQIGTPPILGTFTHTGLIIYSSLALLVLTGFMLRYQLLKGYVKQVRFFHTSLVTAFYLAGIVHILHGVDAI
jgi:hypothetical protein